MGRLSLHVCFNTKLPQGGQVGQASHPGREDHNDFPAQRLPDPTQGIFSACITCTLVLHIVNVLLSFYVHLQADLTPKVGGGSHSPSPTPQTPTSQANSQSVQQNYVSVLPLGAVSSVPIPCRCPEEFMRVALGEKSCSYKYLAVIKDVCHKDGVDLVIPVCLLFFHNMVLIYICRLRRSALGTIVASSQTVHCGLWETRLLCLSSPPLPTPMESITSTAMRLG